MNNTIKVGFFRGASSGKFYIINTETDKYLHRDGTWDFFAGRGAMYDLEDQYESDKVTLTMHPDHRSGTIKYGDIRDKAYIVLGESYLSVDGEWELRARNGWHEVPMDEMHDAVLEHAKEEAEHKLFKPSYKIKVRPYYLNFTDGVYIYRYQEEGHANGKGKYLHRDGTWHLTAGDNAHFIIQDIYDHDRVGEIQVSRCPGINEGKIYVANSEYPVQHLGSDGEWYEWCHTWFEDPHYVKPDPKVTREEFDQAMETIKKYADQVSWSNVHRR